MNDRDILRLVLSILAIVAWMFALWLTWNIMIKVNADGFMYFLFFIWIVFGIIVLATRSRIDNYENRLKAVEKRLGI